jgi:hypothetical protein
LVLHFSDFSFLVHRPVNQDARHLLAHAMASDFKVAWQYYQREHFFGYGSNSTHFLPLWLCGMCSRGWAGLGRGGVWERGTATLHFFGDKLLSHPSSVLLPIAVDYCHGVNEVERFMGFYMVIDGNARAIHFFQPLQSNVFLLNGKGYWDGAKRLLACFAIYWVAGVWREVINFSNFFPLFGGRDIGEKHVCMYECTYNTIKRCSGWPE